MSTLPLSSYPRGTSLRLDDDALHLRLDDGRELSVPLAWFPRLADASPEARGRWEWIGGGIGIHWPDLDEDVSVIGLLAGRRATV